MDFSLSVEQAALQASARRFAREQMAPVAREIEATGEPLSAAWMKRYAELGFLGINVDPAYGGLGLGNLEALLVLESSEGLAGDRVPDLESRSGRRARSTLRARGTARKVLPAVCRGELVVAVAMSEPCRVGADRPEDACAGRR